MKIITNIFFCFRQVVFNLFFYILTPKLNHLTINQGELEAQKSV